MSGDQIWPILLGISVVLNLLLLLRRPILSWLHRDKGEELASEIMAILCLALLTVRSEDCGCLVYKSVADD